MGRENKMEIKQIHTQNAPAAIGPYSQGISFGNMIFLSGQIPINTQSGEVVKGGIEEQTRQVFGNISAILKQEQSDFSKVIKTTVFLKDLSEFATFNNIYAEYFQEPYPARSCIEVSRLPKDVLVEIEIIAYV